ncbi:MFS family transporter [Babesia ovis]|uniref:MFS family transporter n=1 Tax=Babesia ovis TaxID=5869 RepID=A0A9W5TDL5_BABOV|nr:MFS family transporter [Babesia ovis]
MLASSSDDVADSFNKTVNVEASKDECLHSVTGVILDKDSERHTLDQANVAIISDNGLKDVDCYEDSNGSCSEQASLAVTLYLDSIDCSMDQESMGIDLDPGTKDSIIVREYTGVDLDIGTKESTSVQESMNVTHYQDSTEFNADKQLRRVHPKTGDASRRDDGLVDIIVETSVDEKIVTGSDVETGFKDPQTAQYTSSTATLGSVAPTGATSATTHVSYDMQRLLFSFALCWLSTFVSHVLRMPLSSTKVSIQRVMNLTTRDLTYLDTSYAVFHVLGQMSAPALSSKTHSVVLVALYQFVMGLVMMLLFVPEKLYYFIAAYGFTGFMTAPVWSVLFSHLSEWLPAEYSFPLITFWFAGSELGCMAGILICIYVDATWGWRSPYVVSGLINMVVALMLFCLYDNTKTALSNGRLVDPGAIIRGNFHDLSQYISRVRERQYVDTLIESEETPPESSTQSSTRNFILSGIGHVNREEQLQSAFMSRVYHVTNRVTVLYGKAQRLTIDYVSVLTSVSYMTRIAIASFTLKLVKHCLSSWVNFYVSTMYGFTPAQGNYLTLTLSVGSCMGNVLVAIVCRVFWKERPLTAATWFLGMSSIAVLLFSLMDFSWLVLSYFTCCLCGLFTTAAEAILMARGIKSLCERSRLTQHESLIVYGFLLAASTLGSVCQGFLVASIVDWYGWNVLLGIFVAALMGATWLLHKPSQTEK